MKTAGVAGLVEIATNITKAETNYGITEQEFVKLIDTAARISHPELGAAAFETVYERNPVLAKAIDVCKSATWTRDRPYLSFGTVPADPFQPRVVVGGDLRDQDDANVAWEALCLIGSRMAPAATPETQFAVAFSDPRNAALAQRVHRRPSPSTVFPMPFASQGAAKSNRSSSDGAYGELLAKAKELQAANPGMSEAVAFERIYTDKANIALAKRERMENAPR